MNSAWTPLFTSLRKILTGPHETTHTWKPNEKKHLCPVNSRLKLSSSRLIRAPDEVHCSPGTTISAPRASGLCGSTFSRDNSKIVGLVWPRKVHPEFWWGEPLHPHQNGILKQRGPTLNWDWAERVWLGNKRGIAAITLSFSAPPAAHTSAGKNTSNNLFWTRTETERVCACEMHSKRDRMVLVIVLFSALGVAQGFGSSKSVFVQNWHQFSTQWCLFICATSPLAMWFLQCVPNFGAVGPGWTQSFHSVPNLCQVKFWINTALERKVCVCVCVCMCVCRSPRKDDWTKSLLEVGFRNNWCGRNQMSWSPRNLRPHSTCRMHYPEVSLHRVSFSGRVFVCRCRNDPGRRQQNLGGLNQRHTQFCELDQLCDVVGSPLTTRVILCHVCVVLGADILVTTSFI